MKKTWPPPVALLGWGNIPKKEAAHEGTLPSAWRDGEGRADAQAGLLERQRVLSRESAIGRRGQTSSGVNERRPTGGELWQADGL